MDKKETLKDRLMDELLREDARGEAADEKLLAAVEAAIDGEVEDGKVTPIAGRRSRAPYAWAAVLTVSAASVVAYLGWQASDRNGRADLSNLAMEPEVAMEPTRTPVPGKQALGRKARFGNNSPVTDRRETEPAAGAVASQGAPDTPAPAGGETVSAVVPDPTVAPVPTRPANPAPRVRSVPMPAKSIVVNPGDPALPAGVVPAGNRAVPLGNNIDGVDHSDPASAVDIPIEINASVIPMGDVDDRLSKEKREIVGGPSPGAKDADGSEFGDFGRHAPPTDRERYGQLVEQPWKTPLQARFSTFSVDVDTASYTNIRRMLQQGARVPADAVRIEECINYFDYRYAPPTKGGPFAVHVDMARCPWAADHHLMKVGIKGMEVNGDERPASNLVFLIDVSGSMQGTAKLPLLVESMKVLVEELDDRDRVGIVVYAGSEGVVLNPTSITEDGRGTVLAALNKLRAGGSTNGGAGIKRAYGMAREQFIEGGVNRVILATDGDFNVGTTGQGELVKLVQEQAKSGVYLSVLGFGSGNINDAMLEAITNDGNGNYFYIDSQKEGRKVFLQDLSGTLVTIAKDVKIQVDFNPGKVQAYRLIGYANRILRDRDFNDDKVDAGDIGAGHTVTALYEIVPHGAPMPAVGGVDASKYDTPVPQPKLVPSDEWLTVKLRYKAPDGDTSTKMEVPVSGAPVAWEAATDDFRFASGVALFGMKLRNSEHVNDAGWDLVRELARKGLGVDVHGYRAEFLDLVDKAAAMAPVRHDPQPGIEAPAAR